MYTVMGLQREDIRRIWIDGIGDIAEEGKEEERITKKGHMGHQLSSVGYSLFSIPGNLIGPNIWMLPINWLIYVRCYNDIISHYNYGTMHSYKLNDCLSLC